MNWWSRESVRMVLKYLWICSLIILALQGYSAYSRLPLKVATHFNTSGIPNGWSSRQEFFILLYSIAYGINVVCFLLLISFPRMIHGKGASTLSIPNKAYWLATDERKTECARIMQAMMYGLMLVINFMMGYILHIIVQSNVNMGRPFSVWDFLIPIGPFMIYIGVSLLTAFRETDR